MTLPAHMTELDELLDVLVEEFIARVGERELKTEPPGTAANGPGGESTIEDEDFDGNENNPTRRPASAAT